MQIQHVPVMLEEVLKFLQPEPGGHYVDGTSGGGGHTEAILERSAPEGRVLGIDADAQALERVKQRLSDTPAYTDVKTRDGAHVRELAEYFWRASARIVELRRAPLRSR